MSSPRKGYRYSRDNVLVNFLQPGIADMKGGLAPAVVYVVSRTSRKKPPKGAPVEGVRVILEGQPVQFSCTQGFIPAVRARICDIVLMYMNHASVNYPEEGCVRLEYVGKRQRTAVLHEPRFERFGTTCSSL